MPRFFVDCQVGDEIHRDAEGEAYSDAATAIFIARHEAGAYAAMKVAHGECIDGEVRWVRDEGRAALCHFTLVEALASELPPRH